MAQFDYYWQCDCSLPDHPKVTQVADILGVSHAEALAIIVTFFCRVRRHAPSGDVTLVSERTVDHWCGFQHVPDAIAKPPSVLDALIEAGFVDVTKAGSVVHGWPERYGKIQAKLAADAERQRRRRANQSSADVTRTSRGKSRGRPMDGRDQEEEGEVEEEVTTPLPPQGGASDLSKKWNDLAAEVGLPKVESLNPERRRKANARVKEGLLERWEDFAAAMRGPAGQWHREQRVGFDWLIRPGKAQALVEKGNVVPVKSAEDLMWEEVERKNRELYPDSYADEREGAA